MNNELVSIIIPVYNVEQFLEDCLKSVTAQTYKNIQIILIDDGSNDLSGGMCDNYALSEERAIVIHQENQGLSGARNRGLDVADGEYVTFLDSDDMLHPQFIEVLYRAIKTTKSDIAVCDYLRFPESTRYSSTGDEKIISTDNKIMVFDNKESIKQVYENKYHGMQYISCGKLYRKSIINDRGIRFPIGKIHEDTFTTYKIIYEANLICYVDIPLYLYRERSGSITQSGFSNKSLVKFDAIKEECEFFKSHKENDLLELSFYQLLYEKKLTLKSMIGSGNITNAEINRFAKSLRTDLVSYKNEISVPIKKKMFYYALSYFPVLSKLGR